VVDRIRKFVPGVEVTFVDEAIMNQLSYDVASSRLQALGFKCVGDMERGIESTVALLRQANSAAAPELRCWPSNLSPVCDNKRRV